MNKLRSRKVLTQALIVGILMISARTLANAQGICVPDTMSVIAVSGKVVADLDKGETALTQASVTLMKGPENGPVIATHAVDAKGRFNFDHLKPGKYRLKVSTPHLLDFYLDLILKPSRAVKNEKEVVIKIGADLIKPCGGSSAELRVKKDADPQRQ